MTKLKLILAGVGALAFIIIIIALWFGYNELKTLRLENSKLQTYIMQLDAVIESEQLRATKIEEATIRLEEKDNDRQQQLQRFSSSLNKLAKENEAYRVILDIIIPDDLVTELKSFTR